MDHRYPGLSFVANAVRKGISFFCAFAGPAAALAVVAQAQSAAPAASPSAEVSSSANAAPRQQRVVTLMPLGDSITEIPLSYRYPLMQQLQDAGYSVKYVGSKTSYPNPGYPELGRLAHEGHGGKTVQFLVERIKAVYPSHPADIILLHAGHNQFADQKPIPGMIAATREIIEAAREVNPWVTILLGQVITSGKLPKYSYIPEFNAELAKLAQEMGTTRSRIILVDTADGWEWETDTVADQVHPSKAGGEKMAKKWFETLVTILPEPQPSQSAVK